MRLRLGKAGRGRGQGEEVVWVVAGERCSWGKASADQKLGHRYRSVRKGHSEPEEKWPQPDWPQPPF